jgi:hypothetical protein
MSYTAQLFESLRRSAVGADVQHDVEPTLGRSNVISHDTFGVSSRLKADFDTAPETRGQVRYTATVHLFISKGMCYI